jgi:hypothetical protein
MEELSSAEKRLGNEGFKLISALRESIGQYEARMKEREKLREKLDKVTSATDRTVSIEERMKRQNKLTAAENATKLHKEKLKETQRLFYETLPRIHSDVHLAVLRSTADAHIQLTTFVEYFTTTHHNSSAVFTRVLAMLRGAELDMYHSFEDSLQDPVKSEEEEAAARRRRSRWSSFMRLGVQGYEMKLQSVLDGLLKHLVAAQSSPSSLSSSSSPSKTLLDMSEESTARLAASNPRILSELPEYFCQSIGAETCVWVNNLSGRLYRDVCHSNYFYKWFCAKLTYLMNKGPRPGFVEQFEVLDAEFGAVPPLLSNVRWCPLFTDYGAAHVTGLRQSSSRVDKARRREGDKEDNSSDEDEKEKEKEKQKEERDKTSKQHVHREDARLNDGAAQDEFDYYAASTADMAFRSGIKFTISTK